MQYHRYLESELKGEKSAGKARLVLGGRQTGKSTLFSLVRPPTAVMIDLQERSERMRFLRDPASLSRTLEARKEKHVHVFIDEVQKVPELLDEVQWLLDRRKNRFTFTLTGSSARRLRRGEANLLPGRTHRHVLSPVCHWEEAGRTTCELLPPLKRSFAGDFPTKNLEDLLVLGSLPAAYTEGSQFRKTLESYAEVYIEEEILREMAARNLGDYGRFLELAALQSGQAINLTKISQESGLALSTLRGFYRVLEDTLLGFSVPPFTRSGRSRVLKTPRFFFFDVGVRNAVARLSLDKGLVRAQGGVLFEHWVGCELQARIGYLGRPYRLSYWRTVDGAEVDFILENGREAIPVEVKFTERPRPEDARGVEHFIERHPNLAHRGFVVCRAPRVEQLTRRVRAVPWNLM